MTGNNIKSLACNWATPFKEGKTVIKADFEDLSGNILHATMTLEGKDEKVTFTMAIAEMPNLKIRVMLDSFNEKR